MANSKTPSSFGTKKPRMRWTYNPVVAKSNHRGFLAGKPFGVFVHYDKMRSIPCCEAMTDKAVRCEYCEKGLVPDWRGYVPYYCEQYTPNFVLITYPYYESVCEIPHLEQIVIRRGPKKTDGVVIKGEPWRTTPIPASKDRALPVDLGDFLIHVLFKCDVLIEWDRREKAKAPVQEVKPYVGPAESVFEDKDLKNMRRLLEREKKANEETELAGILASRVINDALNPKPNGKHTKPVS